MSHSINKAKWDKFKELLNEIVDMPNKSCNEKIAIVKAEAETRGDKEVMNLDEFGSWDFES